MIDCFAIRSLSAVAAAFCLGISAGCAAAPGGGPSPTAGIEIDMLVEDGDSIALYRVTADGMLAFAGGLDARRRNFTWSGRLHQDEIARLLSLLEEHGWRDGTAADQRAGRSEAAADAKPVHTIRVRSPQRTTRLKIEGDRDDAAAVHNALREASLRRLDPFLERLPEPGPMPR